MPETDTSKISFHAGRTDGMGERLRAMINAMVLAKKFGGGFSFSWPDHIQDPSVQDIKEIGKFHTISDAAILFSANFIEAHKRPRQSNPSYVALNHSCKSAEDLEKAVRDGQKDILVNTLDLFDIVKDAETLVTTKDFAEAYKAMDFADPINEAREIAYSVPIGENSVALHLRAGDIIYGEYRFSDNLIGKAIPFPMAREIIRLRRAKGEKVILFGQDADLCSYLGDQEGALLAHELAAPFGFDPNQTAIFDMTLMSRCSEVIAGNSGFAIFAGLVSGAQITSPRTQVTPRKLLEITQTDEGLSHSDQRLSKLQRAFAYWYPVFLANHIATPEQKLQLISKAIDQDPENLFYYIVKAHHLAQQNKAEEAEKTLSLICSIDSGQHASGESTLAAILTARRPGTGKLRLDNYRSTLFELANLGLPNAALCAALMARAEGDDERFAHYNALAGSRA